MYYTSLEFGPTSFCTCIKGCFAGIFCVCMYVSTPVGAVACAHMWRPKDGMDTFLDLHLI